MIFMGLSRILCKRKQGSDVSISYIWILFPNISINWFIIKPQFETGTVHFFSISTKKGRGGGDTQSLSGIIERERKL